MECYDSQPTRPVNYFEWQHGELNALEQPSSGSGTKIDARPFEKIITGALEEWKKYPTHELSYSVVAPQLLELAVRVNAVASELGVTLIEPDESAIAVKNQLLEGDPEAIEALKSQCLGKLTIHGMSTIPPALPLPAGQEREIRDNILTTFFEALATESFTHSKAIEILGNTAEVPDFFSATVTRLENSTKVTVPLGDQLVSWLIAQMTNTPSAAPLVFLVSMDSKQYGIYVNPSRAEFALIDPNWSPQDEDGIRPILWQFPLGNRQEVLRRVLGMLLANPSNAYDTATIQFATCLRSDEQLKDEPLPEPDISRSEVLEPAAVGLRTPYREEISDDSFNGERNTRGRVRRVSFSKEHTVVPLEDSLFQSGSLGLHQGASSLFDSQPLAQDFRGAASAVFDCEMALIGSHVRKVFSDLTPSKVAIADYEQSRETLAALRNRMLTPENILRAAAISFATESSGSFFDSVTSQKRLHEILQSAENDARWSRFQTSATPRSKVPFPGSDFHNGRSVMAKWNGEEVLAALKDLTTYMGGPRLIAFGDGNNGWGHGLWVDKSQGRYVLIEPCVRVAGEEEDPRPMLAEFASLEKVTAGLMRLHKEEGGSYDIQFFQYVETAHGSGTSSATSSAPESVPAAVASVIPPSSSAATPSYPGQGLMNSVVATWNSLLGWE